MTNPRARSSSVEYVDPGFISSNFSFALFLLSPPSASVALAAVASLRIRSASIEAAASTSASDAASSSAAAALIAAAT
jgi:hypothetical protein